MLYDRVEQTTTTTGTGTLSLIAPTDASRRSFVQAAGSGNLVYYCIETTDGLSYEYGYGTATAGTPDTLTRNVITSSNSNALVNFPSGTKRVFCTLPAAELGIVSRTPTSPGYQRLLGGLILQHGTASTIPAGGTVGITFPLTFPNTVRSLVATIALTTNAGGGALRAHPISVTGFNLNNPGTDTVNAYWIALGS